jgi:hypothetical protein
MEIYVEDLKRLAFLDNKSSAAAFEASPHLEVFKDPRMKKHGLTLPLRCMAQ